MVVDHWRKQEEVVGNLKKERFGQVEVEGGEEEEVEEALHLLCWA